MKEDRGAVCYKRFLDGDESAFEEILNDYRDGLTFFINRFVNNVDVAEDIAANEPSSDSITLDERMISITNSKRRSILEEDLLSLFLQFIRRAFPKAR